MPDVDAISTPRAGRSGYPVTDNRKSLGHIRASDGEESSPLANGKPLLK